MNQHQYRLLVRRLEVEASISPGAYRTKVFLISSAAYVVLFGMLLATALLLYFGIRAAYAEERTYNLIHIVLFGMLMLPVFFVVLRMFFTRLPPPEGRHLRREEAPKLFNALDKVQKQLNGPPFHHVLIDESFNAAIIQQPRWGLFGWHTNYLILGLPYLLGVPPKEMLATIAHEYSHVCGNHGKFSAWVYRQSITFGALYDKVKDSAEDNWVYIGIAKMLNAFKPYYDAYTFVLSREDEYTADKTATELVGGKINAQGLIRDRLLGRWFEEAFWPRLYKQADSQEEPSSLPYVAMPDAFKAGYQEWASKELLDAAWRERSGLEDTHPSLRERVEATGEKAGLPPAVENTAADMLLGEVAKTLIEEFDHRWWEQEKTSWNARLQYVTSSKVRLRELSRVRQDSLKLQDLHEYALLCVEFGSVPQAKDLLELLLQQPGGPFPKASFHYGCILLAEDNERGLDHLTIAINDRHMREPAAQAGYDYLIRKYGEERAEEWWDKTVDRVADEG